MLVTSGLPIHREECKGSRVRRSPKAGLAVAAVAAFAALIAVVGLISGGKDAPAPPAAASSPSAKAQPASQEKAVASPAVRRGKKVFRAAGCGSCHTLAAAAALALICGSIGLRISTAASI